MEGIQQTIADGFDSFITIALTLMRFADAVTNLIGLYRPIRHFYDVHGTDHFSGFFADNHLPQRLLAELLHQQEVFLVHLLKRLETAVIAAVLPVIQEAKAILAVGHAKRTQKQALCFNFYFGKQNLPDSIGNTAFSLRLRNSFIIQQYLIFTDYNLFANLPGDGYWGIQPVLPEKLAIAVNPFVHKVILVSP